MNTYTLNLTEEELQALGVLLDGGVRHDGLKTVHAASAILRKIEAAQPDILELTEEATDELEA